MGSKKKYERIAVEARLVAEGIQAVLDLIPVMPDEAWLAMRGQTVELITTLKDGFITANIKLVELGLEYDSNGN